MEIGGTDPPSTKITVDAATNTETRTYAQAAARTQVETEAKGKGKDKEKGPKPPAVTSEGLKGSGVAVGLPHWLPYVEYMSDYEKEEEEAGTMTNPS